ncbi:MAG: hypothetical protein H6726_07885 [Sandaracinaceae bacterium]|nr:hypothetical protein [Sandaracinaceae bacterium]
MTSSRIQKTLRAALRASLILSATAPGCGSPADNPPGSDGGVPTDAQVDTGSAMDLATGLDAGNDQGASDHGVAPDAGPPWMPATYTTYNQSGTRLEALAVTDPNDNSAIAWFQDTLLGVRCGVRRATDGEHYCIPEVVDIEAAGGFAYLDDACTMPAVLLETGCSGASYAQFRSNDPYEMTAAAQPDVWYASFGGTCDAATVPGGYALQRLTAVPLSTFVQFPEADATVHAIDTAVGVRVLHGTDGSSIGVELYDRVANRPALVASIPTGTDGNGQTTYELRLVPQNPFSASITSYERYDCAVQGQQFANAFVAELVDPAPAFVQVVILPPQIPQNSSHFRRITAVQTQYCDAGGVLRTVGPNQRVYVLGGPAADLSAQPLLTLRPGVGTGTQHEHYLTAAELPIIPRGSLEPTEMSVVVGGAAAQVVDFDGALYAAPPRSVQPVWERIFADGSCETPLALEGSFAAGDLLLIEAATAYRSCPRRLTRAPRAMRAAYRVANETPSPRGTVHYLQEIGGMWSCQSRNAFDEHYRSTAAPSGALDSLFPTLSTEAL